MELESWSESSDNKVPSFDYFSGETIGKQLKNVKRSISELLFSLTEPPLRPKDSLMEIHQEGWIYRKFSGSTVWKRYYAVLVGDMIFFYKNPETTSSKAEVQVAYWTYMDYDIEDELTKLQIRDGVRCSLRIQVFTDDLIVSISFESQEDGDAWCTALRRSMRRKYNKSEIKGKSEILAELMPKFTEQTKLLEEQYDIIMDALEKSGFCTTEANPKKLMEGYLEHKKSGSEEWRKMYVVLYKESIYVFKPHDSVSTQTRPKTLINLKFIEKVEPSKTSDDTFIITTPIRSFTLKAKHSVVVSDWIEKIELAVAKRKGIKNDLVIEKFTKYESMGYTYDAMLSFKMFKLASLNGKRRVYKFPKGKEQASVGRSSSSDITIKDDDYISRNHCKIEIFANIPYLLDLGSGTGTLLNNESVTVSPLKPGDTISIGQTQLEFQVKIPAHLFHINTPKRKKRKRRTETKE